MKVKTDLERVKENLRRSRRDEREWYLSRGVCPQCKKNKLAAGKTLCEDCLEYRRAYTYERYHTDGEFREKIIAANKEIQKRWRREGLCPRCGAPVDDGFSHCKRCREYFHASNNRYRSKKRAEREAAYAAGEPRPKRGRPRKNPIIEAAGTDVAVGADVGADVAAAPRRRRRRK